MTHATKISFDDDDFASPKQHDCLRGVASGGERQREPEIHCTRDFCDEEDRGGGGGGIGYSSSWIGLLGPFVKEHIEQTLMVMLKCSG